MSGRRHLPFAGRARQQGFVLALTLGVLAAVMFVAAYLAESLSLSLQTAQIESDRARAEELLFSARAEALYRMSTQRRSSYGMGSAANPVKLDGTPYRQADDVVVAYQDARGLISLSGAPPAWLRLLLLSVGAAPNEIDPLLDVLNDYIDADNLRRVNGAEADDYAALGLAPPANRALITAAELRRLPRWRDHPAIWKNGLADLVAVVPSQLFNPNTAPPGALRAVPGVSPESSAVLMELRKAGRQIGLSELESIGGASINALYSPVSTFPSDTLFVTHWPPGQAWGVRMAITITPASLYGPWRILYIDRVESPPAAPAKNGFPNLPSRGSGADAPAATLLPGGGSIP